MSDELLSRLEPKLESFTEHGDHQEVLQREKPEAVTQWQPQRWSTKHEHVMALHNMGMDNVSISETVGFTPEHVSNIINSPQGRILRKMAVECMRKSADANINDRLQKLAEKSLARVEELIENDTYAAEHPLAVADRAFRILQGVGVMRDQTSPTLNDKTVTISIPADYMERLNIGLDRSKEVAARLLAG